MAAAATGNVGIGCLPIPIGLPSFCRRLYPTLGRSRNVSRAMSLELCYQRGGKRIGKNEYYFKTAYDANLNVKKINAC